MSHFANVMQILQLLEKSNCRECGEKSCMAFSAAVFTGKKQLSDCPKLPEDVAARHGHQDKRPTAPEQDFETMRKALTSQLLDIDFAAKAERLGATCDADRLSLKIMGKDLRIDRNGKVYTDLHVNSWLYVSTLNYIINCGGHPLSGRWVQLRDLPGGRDWYRLFGQQCEKQLKQTADTYPDLFSDLVHMFSGKQVVSEFQADVAVILHPLPKVPMHICYWQPEEGMESSLNVFFDDTAAMNLGMKGLYLLGTGIALMLKRLAQLHGVAPH